METSTKYASDLADRIISKRRLGVYDEFFEYISESTWRKYFKDRKLKNGKTKPPYLIDGLHGWIVVDKNGKKKYRMISKSKWRIVKKGKKRVPSAAELTRQKKIADELIDTMDKEAISKHGIINGYAITLNYSDKEPNEYKGFYMATNRKTEPYGNMTYYGNMRMTQIPKKMSRLDKDILICIGEWASDNNLEVVVSSSFEY